MTEEEKNAIEELKELAKGNCMPPELYFEDAQTILNLIEKQQKEIKELKENKDTICISSKQYGKTYNITKDYISKDKIRDKIKELEEYQKQHKEGNWADIPIEDYDFDKINLLKELLEKIEKVSNGD